jgi:transcription antitermination factor NusG
VKIDCYISHGCGSEEALKENIERALESERIQAKVGMHRISDEKATELKLSGSPSVFINGKELQPSETIGFS